MHSLPFCLEVGGEGSQRYVWRPTKFCVGCRLRWTRGRETCRGFSYNELHVYGVKALGSQTCFEGSRDYKQGHNEDDYTHHQD